MKTNLAQIKSVLFQLRNKVDFNDLSKEGIDNEILSNALNDTLQSLRDLSGDKWNQINEILNK